MDKKGNIIITTVILILSVILLTGCTAYAQTETERIPLTKLSAKDFDMTKEQKEADIQKQKEIALIEQQKKEAEEKAAKIEPIPYDALEWSDEKIDYVLVWGPKNNSFLIGTPMEGLGWYIAAKAYDYNVDPALLSSIAYIESHCGVYPYDSEYNAYGWICMNPEMYSWEDGIDKWYAFFGEYFGGDIPVSSMHGYGDYGVDSIYPCLEEIRNA